MSRRLTAPELPALIVWLQHKRPLGFALTDTQVAVGDATGESWVFEATNLELLGGFVAALSDSGRKVWAEEAAKTSLRLARRLQFDVDALSWLFDATTAGHVVYPGVWRESNSKGAARDASATARFVVALPDDASAATRAAVWSSCAQEQLWRSRQLEGHPIDVELLNKELTMADAHRVAAIAELGIDITDSASVRGSTAIHAWLAPVGIFLVDAKGVPSLSRDLYDRVSIPETDEAQSRWKKFREVRSVASRVGKLREIQRALNNGCTHSTLYVRRARTGRGAVTGPALQNIHRGLRPLLMAPVGEVLVSPDFSQMEPRVSAGLSQDPDLLAALESGDLYAELSRRIWGAEADGADGKPNPLLRDRAKTLMLGIFYGEGKNALGRALGIEPKDAKVLLDSVWAAFPGLQAYDLWLQSEVRAGRPAFTQDGRPVPPPKKGLHAALNNRVQAESADIFWAAVARVAAVLGAKALYLGVHDELVVSVPANRSEWARIVLEREMNTVFRGVPITGAAVVIGRSWRKT